MYNTENPVLEQSGILFGNGGGYIGHFLDFVLPAEGEVAMVRSRFPENTEEITLPLNYSDKVEGWSEALESAGFRSLPPLSLGPVNAYLGLAIGKEVAHFVSMREEDAPPDAILRIYSEIRRSALNDFESFFN